MRFYKIKDIGTIISGATPKTNIAEYWDGHILWATPKDLSDLDTPYLIDTERKITKVGYQSCSTQLIPKGSILFSSRAPIGLIAIATTEVCTNQGFKSIVLNPEFDSLYVYYLLRFNTSRLKALGTGSTFLELSKTKFENFDVVCHEYKDQIRIGKLLFSVETLIKQRKESIALLDEFLRSTFLKMFGDPAKNGNNFPTGTIRDLVLDVKYGTSKSSTADGKYPYLRMNNITFAGLMDYSDLKYIDISDSEKEKYVVKRGDLLFNRTNSKELVGKTAVYERREEMVIAGYLIRVRTNAKGNPYYLWGYLNSDHGKKTLSSMCKTIVGMANINAQELQNIKIMIPPIQTQNRFAYIVEKTEAVRAQFQQSLQELENLYGSLSQRFFQPSQEVEDKRYGDPFSVDEETAKAQGEEFYGEWKKLQQKKLQENLKQAHDVAMGKTKHGKIETILIGQGEFEHVTGTKFLKPWRETSKEQIARLIKQEFKDGHFTLKELETFLLENVTTSIDYHSTEELKMDVKLDENDDLRAFITSALDKQQPNPYLQLQQVFYNVEKKNVALRRIDKGKFEKLPFQQQTGLYFSIVHED